MQELKIFGEDAVFDHVGLALNSIEDVCIPSLEVFVDQVQKVSVAFIDFNGINVELIAPLSEESPVMDGLRKGRKLVHMCFRVPDLDAAIEKARQYGFHRISKPVAAVAFNNKKIVWLLSPTYGLVELVEQ